MTNSTIVCIRAESPAVIAEIIERLCDQSMRNELLKVLPRRGIFTNALAKAVVAKKGGEMHDLFFVVMSDTDMLVLRMMDVQITAYADFDKFCEMPNDPDLADLQRSRFSAITARERQLANHRFYVALADMLDEIVK